MGWLTDAQWERCERRSTSPVIARTYASDRSDDGTEALAEAAIHEDGTIHLSVVLYH
jgi:hypothetical protein